MPPPPPVQPPPPRDDHRCPLPCSRRRHRLCRRRLGTDCMIRPQSSMSKHIPVSIRRSAASRAGFPRPPPHLQRRLCSEPGVLSPAPRAGHGPGAAVRRAAARGTGFLVPAEVGAVRAGGGASAAAAGRAGRHKSRFVIAASALGPPAGAPTGPAASQAPLFGRTRAARPGSWRRGPGWGEGCACHCGAGCGAGAAAAVCRQARRGW